MIKQSIRGLVAVLSLALALALQANPMTDYNLILLEDYNYFGGEVEGATLIGGSLNGAGHSPTFATRPIAAFDSLTVVGDVNAANLNINAGDFTYGGNLNLGNINMNGGGSIVHNPSLSIANVEAELYGLSALYASLADEGTFNNGLLTYSGSGDLAVFDLNYSDVFAQNSSLNLDYGSAESVIINVSGKNISVGGGVNITGGFRDLGAQNILWNFLDAETIDFNGLGVYGGVLASSADVSGGSVFDGAFAARSYTGSREFHLPLFNPPSVDVPEPEQFAVLMVGFALLSLGRLRKKRRV